MGADQAGVNITQGRQGVVHPLRIAPDHAGHKLLAVVTVGRGQHQTPQLPVNAVYGEDAPEPSAGIREANERTGPERLGDTPPPAGGAARGAARAGRQGR